MSNNIENVTANTLPIIQSITAENKLRRTQNQDLNMNNNRIIGVSSELIHQAQQALFKCKMSN